MIPLGNITSASRKLMCVLGVCSSIQMDNKQLTITFGYYYINRLGLGKNVISSDLNRLTACMYTL